MTCCLLTRHQWLQAPPPVGVENTCASLPGRSKALTRPRCPAGLLPSCGFAPGCLRSSGSRSQRPGRPHHPPGASRPPPHEHPPQLPPQAPFPAVKPPGLSSRGWARFILNRGKKRQSRSSTELFFTLRRQAARGEVLLAAFCYAALMRREPAPAGAGRERQRRLFRPIQVLQPREACPTKCFVLLLNCYNY